MGNAVLYFLASCKLLMKSLMEGLLNPLSSKFSEFCPKRVLMLRLRWLSSKRLPYQLHTFNLTSILLSLLRDFANFLLVP